MSNPPSTIMPSRPRPATVTESMAWDTERATPTVTFTAEDIREALIRSWLSERESHIQAAIGYEIALAMLGRKVSKPLCGR